MNIEHNAIAQANSVKVPDQLISMTSDASGEIFVESSMGHSHSDYYLRFSLREAFRFSLLSVEADVFCVDNE